MTDDKDPKPGDVFEIHPRSNNSSWQRTVTRVTRGRVYFTSNYDPDDNNIEYSVTLSGWLDTDLEKVPC